MSFSPSIYSQSNLARINQYHASSHGGLARVEGPPTSAANHLARDTHSAKLQKHLKEIRGHWVSDHRGTGFVVQGGDKRTPAEALRLLARRKEFGVLDRKHGRTVPLRQLCDTLDENEKMVLYFRIVHADQTPEALLAAGLPTEGTDARASAGVAMWLAQPHGGIPPSLRWCFVTAGTQTKVTLTLDPRGALREQLMASSACLKQASLTDCINLGSGKNVQTRALLEELERGTLSARAQVAALFLDGCMAHDHARSSAEQELASKVYRGLFIAQDQLVQRLATESLTNPGALMDARVYFEADPRLVDFVADHVVRHHSNVTWDWKPWQRLLT